MFLQNGIPCFSYFGRSVHLIQTCCTNWHVTEPFCQTAVDVAALLKLKHSSCCRENREGGCLQRGRGAENLEFGTWWFPGYEPKRFTGQMSEFHRRRATKEEIEQGQKEIRLADERMKTEAESRGEMPIQNGPEEKPEDVVKGETSPPKEGKRDEPQRGTPARSSNQGSGVKALLPPTQPPPDPPAFSLRQEVVSSLEKNTPADKGEGNFNGGPLMREIATPPEQQAGDDANQVQGQSMAPPLFTEEQLRNFAALQGQAAWMYGPQQSFFNPIGFSRPSFLDGDAARASVSQHERDMEFLRMQAVRDREEKDECRRQIQLLVEENRQLRARFESASKMQTEDEPRFATPEEQPDQTSPGMWIGWSGERRLTDPHQRRLTDLHQRRLTDPH